MKLFLLILLTDSLYIEYNGLQSLLEKYKRCSFFFHPIRWNQDSHLTHFPFWLLSFFGNLIPGRMFEQGVSMQFIVSALLLINI